MQSDKIKIDIISGFLGAGKTTLIKKLIEHVLVGEEIIVLENEFGEINIDGENIAQTGVVVESVIAGCICCSGAATLAQKIVYIAQKYKPKRIVIEPSGIARLSDIRKLLRMPSIYQLCEIDHVITIVDATNYYKRIKISKEFFEDQIRFSDIVYLSKTDDLELAKLDEVKHIIGEINPNSPIIYRDPILYKTLLLEEKPIKKNIEDIPSRYMYLQQEDVAKFESFSLEKDMRVDKTTIDTFFTKVENGEVGEIHRVKGCFTNTENISYTIEYVPNDLRIEERNNSEKIRICIIGLHLNKNLIKEILTSK